MNGTTPPRTFAAQLLALADMFEREAAEWNRPGMQRTRWLCAQASTLLIERAHMTSDEHDAFSAEIWVDQARALILSIRDKRDRLARLQQSVDHLTPVRHAA